MIRRYHRILGLGVKNLLLHKARSFLTMLGIVFGVGSVIAMLAVGEGASREASRAIASLGSANIILESVEPPQDASRPQSENTARIPMWQRKYGLTRADRNRILRTIPDVIGVHAETERTDEVSSAATRRRVTIKGSHVHAPTVRNLHPVDGRFFNQIEYRNAAAVCVISPSLRRKLFPFGGAIGRSIRIEGDYYKVLGEFSPGADAPNTAGQPDADAATAAAREDVVYLPLSTARARVTSFRYSRTEYDTLVVRTTGPQSVAGVGEAVEALLSRNREQPDYRIIIPLELLAQARQTQRLFNVIIGSIAAISLLVGGIGIMNIMLATVTERTREIGIRRALGARRRDIISQFLAETVVISFAGGLLGILLGLVIPGLISGATGVPTVVTPVSVILSVVISVLIGIVFGIYPARRAAALDPIDALRH